MPEQGTESGAPTTGRKLVLLVQLALTLSAVVLTTYVIVTTGTGLGLVLVSFALVGMSMCLRVVI